MVWESFEKKGMLFFERRVVRHPRTPMRWLTKMSVVPLGVNSVAATEKISALWLKQSVKKRMQALPRGVLNRD